MNDKPHVYILATGGTIASLTQQLTGEHYGYASIGIEELLVKIPEINDLANICSEQVAQLDSSDMTQAIWLKLARRTAELVARDDVDAIVITHGSDTIEETAYFLELVINTTKPIIFTGAMRPAQALSADGLRNLYNAVVLAISQQAQGKGALLTFNDTICGARDVIKTNVSSTDSFRAPELGLLGYIYSDRVYFYKQALRRHTAQSEFNIDDIDKLPKVEIAYGYTDSDPVIVDALIKARVRGIVSAGLGKGYQPPPVKQALINARQQGIIVVRAARATSGVVTPEPGLDDKYGFITADTLSPQKARILLAVALTKTQDIDELQRIFCEY